MNPDYTSFCKATVTLAPYSAELPLVRTRQNNARPSSVVTLPQFTIAHGRKTFGRAVWSHCLSLRPRTEERHSAEQCGHIASVYDRARKKDIRPCSVVTLPQFTTVHGRKTFGRAVWSHCLSLRPHTEERHSAVQCGHITSVYDRTRKKDVPPRSVFSFQFTVISAEMDIDSQMCMLKTSPVLKMLLFEDQKSIWMNKIYE
jgi:hypothetical protein